MGFFGNLFGSPEGARDLVDTYIEYIKAAGAVIDLRVKNEPYPHAKLILLYSLKIAIENSSEESFAEASKSLQRYYDASIMQVVDDIVKDILKFDIQFLKDVSDFRTDEHMWQKLKRYIESNVAADEPTGETILCEKVHEYFNG